MTREATRARRAAELERRADPDLKVKLRLMIAREGLTALGLRLGITTEALAKYLADLPLYGPTFYGVEAGIARAEVRTREEEPDGLL
jgi:hypothetical protein